MDGPEIHAPHAAHTGHRWVDILLGLTALLVSGISLFVAVEHGHTMEKLVAANSWPNVTLDSQFGAGTAPGSTRLALDVANSGVGPARIESVELWVGKTPIADVTGLVTAIKAAGGGGKFEAQLEGRTIAGSVIGARETVTLVALTNADGAHWAQPMVKVAAQQQSRVCYCSVFDECYVVDTRIKRGHPLRVDACAVPPTAFSDDPAEILSGRTGAKVTFSNGSR